MVRPSPEVSLNNPLNDSHVSGDTNYINSCALRLGIALSSYGIDLNGVPGANNIGAKGNSQALGGKKHVIISAAQMAAHLRTLLGTPDYPDDGENGYWSRRIDSKNRLVYRVDEGAIIAIQLRYHYEK